MGLFAGVAAGIALNKLAKAVAQMHEMLLPLLVDYENGIDISRRKDTIFTLAQMYRIEIGNRIEQFGWPTSTKITVVINNRMDRITLMEAHVMTFNVLIHLSAALDTKSRETISNILAGE